MASAAALYLRAVRSDWKAAPARLLFFMACLAIGVAAVVTVATHAAALDNAIRREARQLLAADLAVRGAQPIPQAAREQLEAWGARLAETRELVTIVSTGPDDRITESGSSLLVELKAADPGYPFYGRLETEPELTVDDLRAEEVLVAPDVLTRLGLTVGSSLRIGGESFEILGVVNREPDRIADGFSLGPRILLSSRGLERTSLVRFGSRIGYNLLAAAPAGSSGDSLEATADALRGAVDSARFRVETFADAQPALRQAIRRATRFTGLVALLSLLLGGVGIAFTLQAWLSQRIDDIAVLRCLGWRPRQVVALYLVQALVIGLAGCIVGCALGIGAAALIPHLVGDAMPAVELVVWQPSAIARGIGLGLGISVIFTLAPILRVGRIPPLRVLRRDVEPLAPSRLLQVALGSTLVGGVWAAAGMQADSPRLGMAFTIGLVAASAVLTAVTRVALGLTGRLARHVRFTVLRQGLLAVARPGAATVGACVALGLGILFVLGMHLVEEGLTRALRSQLPTSAPSVFLVDIQPDQWPGVQQVLRRFEAEGVESVPVVSARLTAVDGVPVTELVEGEGRSDRRWGLTREQRLTYLHSLPADNRVVAGELWANPRITEVSVEQEFAREVGFDLNTELTFEVQGVPMSWTVTSLRAVEWQTFGINFFIVVEPGALEQAPQMRVATARLGGEQEFQDAIARQFPNVTVLRIRSILERIAAILERLAVGVRFLGAFTVVAGIVILASAVSAAASRRGRETALLKTLGMTRRQILGQWAAEHFFIASIAAVIGAAGANFLAWAVLTRGMDLEWHFRTATTLGAVVLAILLTTLAAFSAGWHALTTKPLAVLRER